MSKGSPMCLGFKNLECATCIECPGDYHVRCPSRPGAFKRNARRRFGQARRIKKNLVVKRATGAQGGGSISGAAELIERFKRFKVQSIPRR